ncbi:MAG: hypothetical protein U0746_18370 [Gemmataceae bacterium]
MNPKDSPPAPVPSVRGVARWLDLMETCEQLFLAGLRHKAGPEGDVAAVYRAWNARHLELRERERRESRANRARIGRAN